MNYHTIARCAITLIFSCVSFFASAQLSGVKTIDKNGSGVNNYTSFKAAFNDLNTQGVTAPGVTFLVAGGTAYVEDPLVLTATGTASAPIVFRQFGGVTNAVIYSSKKGSKNNWPTNGDLPIDNDAFIKLVGSDHVTFDGISLVDTTTFTLDPTVLQKNMEYGFYMVRKSTNDACQNITIKNCSIHFALDTAAKYMRYSVGVFQSPYDVNGNTVTPTDTNGRCQNMVYKNISLKRMTTSFWLQSGNSNNVELLNDRNVQVIGCELKELAATSYDENHSYYSGLYTSGFYASKQHKLLIDNNTISDMNIMRSEGRNSSVALFRLNMTNYSSAKITNNTFKIQPFKNDPDKATAYIFFLYNVSGSPNGTDNELEVANNIFDSCFSNSTTGSVLERSSQFFTGSGAITLNIHDNEIKNTRGCIRVGNINGYRKLDMHNNSFHGHRGTVLYAFYVNGQNTMIGNNKWYDIVDSGFTQILQVYPGGLGEVYGNKVYDIHSTLNTETSSSVRVFSITGHYVYNTELRLYNNEVSDVTSDGGTVDAIHINGYQTTNYIYNNTVYLNGANNNALQPYSSTALFLASGCTNYVYNNILVNTSAGSANYVMYQNGGSFTDGYTGNNNVLYAGANNYICSDDNVNIAKTFEDYQNFSELADNDAYSLNIMPPFKNISTKPYDLHIDGSQPTKLESTGYNGPNIFSLAKDIDGGSRPGSSINGGGAGIDIGADEFDGKLVSSMTLRSTNFRQVTKNVFSSDEKQEILRVNIETEGYFTPKKMDTITFKPTGTSNLSYINNSTAYLYWGKKNSSYVKATMISSATLNNGEFKFAANTGLLEGNNYFWISYDIRSSAVVGATFDAEAASVVIDGGKYLLFGSNPSGNRTIDLTPMSGTYTVGTQASTNDFETLTEAVHNLNKRGVVAAVNLELADSVYASNEVFPIRINAINGASKNNRISIYPSIGNNVSITSSNNQNIELYGADYVTLNGAAGNTGTSRNMTLNTGIPTGGAAVVRLRSLGIGQGCEKDTVMNCNIIGSRSDASVDWGIIFDGSNSPNNTCLGCDYGAGNDSNVIMNNKITDVYYGVYASAQNYNNEYMHGNSIIGNEIGEDTSVNASALTIDWSGIYMYEQIGCSIRDNKIRNVAGYSSILLSNSDSCNVTNNDIANVFHVGIWLGAMNNGSALNSVGGWVRNTTVSSNKIYNVTPNIDRHPSGGFAYPILLAASGNGQASNNKIINNFISKYESFGTGSFRDDGAWGIAIIHGDSDLIAHNTIVADANLDSAGNVTQPCGGILITGSSNTSFDVKDLQVLNNIVKVDFTTSNSLLKCPAINIDHTLLGSATTIDWNNYITPNSGNSYVSAIYRSVDHSTVNDWKNSGYDAHSFDESVTFVSNTDLHLSGQSIGNAALRVDHLPSVPTDIDGNTRFAKASYVGADENSAELMQTVQASADATICKGDATSLSATVTGQRSALTYIWAPATGLSNVSLSNPTAAPTVTTQYVVKVTDMYNDDYFDTVVVNVRTSPSTNITGSTVICGSTPILLSADAGMSMYAWSNGSSSRSTLINTAGNYTLKVTDGNSCTDSTQVSISSSPAVDASFTYNVKNLATYEFAAVTASGVSYAWDVDGTKYTQAKPIHTFNSTGFKDVELIVVNNTSGCSDTSDRVIDIQITTDVDNVPNGKEVSLYPNPVKDQIWVRGLSHSLNGTWVIKDYAGRTIMQGDSKTIGSTGIVVSGLAQGLYLLQVSEGDNIVNFKFVKQD